ncbi:ATP-dependent DNA helicase RecG [Pseudomonas aeruginosa]|nr:ATP-dependent DNA helicase RecG [Pseudomonas aeruginosa]
MTIKVTKVSLSDAKKLLSQEESHFNDFKAIEIKPAKLSQTISAFANAEGGDLYIGADETPEGFSWRGYERLEDANGLIQLFEELFPLGDDFTYEFLHCDDLPGYLLHICSKKTQRIIVASDGFPYLRRNALKIKIDTEEKRRRLELDKGIYSFEQETVDTDLEIIEESIVMRDFLSYVIPHRSAAELIKIELLARREKPKVAAVLLFSDLPQAAIPDRSSVKIARYKTTGEANRDALTGPAETVEGPIYSLIYDAVNRTKEIIEESRIATSDGLIEAQYPHETLHEIITNAIIHRDYSIQDHVHIRVFDNRIEIESPGKLAGQVTIENILETRAIRNGKIVRLLNKFPEPPNKDMGEGLNTAFDAMRNVKLKPPRFKETATSFIVIIPHERPASAQDTILEYLERQPTITNKQARQLYAVETQHIMRKILAGMVDNGLIERVEGTQRGGVKYRKV